MQVRNICGTALVEKDQIFVRAFTLPAFIGPVPHLMFPELNMSLQVSHFKTLKISA
jgi:hypothetical protein